MVHASSRPYVCSYCNKGFLSSTKLKQHFNIHTGERPFKCKYCERTFTNYPNWLKHTRRRHKVDHKTGDNLTVEKEEPQTPAPEPMTYFIPFEAPSLETYLPSVDIGQNFALPSFAQQFDAIDSSSVNYEQTIPLTNMIQVAIPQMQLQM